MHKADLAAIDDYTLLYNLLTVFGKELNMPRNYTVFDLETTSLEPEEGHIWQIGIYPVERGRPMCPEGCSLLVRAPEEALRGNAFHIRKVALWTTGKREADLTEQDLADAEEAYVRDVLENGHDPEELIPELADVLLATAGYNAYVVGHNFINFDVPYLETACARLGLNLEFDKPPFSRLVDTGMLVKAAQMPTRFIPGESPYDFYLRVGDSPRRNTFYDLAGFCVDVFRLKDKAEINTSMAHSADVDCWLTSLLMEAMLERAHEFANR